MMNNLMYIVLAMGGEGEGSGFANIIMLVAIVVVFYFFMIRPQMKKQKDLKKYREAIKNGDKVVTVGGIYGKVIEVGDQTVILEVENKVRLKVDKNALNTDASGVIGQK
jgi:preprotein translocase subunit YajC